MSGAKKGAACVQRTSFSDSERTKTGHSTLNTGMTRGGFLRGAGAVVGGVAAAGIGLGNVVKAQTVDYRGRSHVVIGNRMVGWNINFVYEELPGLVVVIGSYETQIEDFGIPPIPGPYATDQTVDKGFFFYPDPNNPDDVQWLSTFFKYTGHDVPVAVYQSAGFVDTIFGFKMLDILWDYVQIIYEIDPEGAKDDMRSKILASGYAQYNTLSTSSGVESMTCHGIINLLKQPGNAVLNASLQFKYNPFYREKARVDLIY